MNEITVMLPAYNEEGNIIELIKKWENYKSTLKLHYQLDLQIVIINDGSVDQTKVIAERLQEDYDNLKLINHPVNQGLGMAVKTGIEYVLKNSSNSEYICFMDCDNTHDPKYIRDMIDKQKETHADVVIASRYQEGASVRGLSKLRRFTCQAAKRVYGTSLHVKGVRDYTCGYRLYKRTILEKLKDKFKDQMIEESGFACMTELLYKLYACGAVFAEVPFELRYDFKQGDSKMKIIRTSINSMKLVIKLKRIKT
ncbi:glycosyltransferase family 2 protein [Cellulosilyticum sp. I15G10I2]|uniref:glycosyltransferase family 2 protein n=1 Tax=Cellulosilyticum sp. I15G10I2 TaxID=1892843 RepID=UPI00085BE373|nr:glycosyltransferase family 2 protein [Cellulosilyticum sp. I15G10I2]